MMNTKNLFTLGAVLNVCYGTWYFVAPQGAAEFYGYGLVTTDLSNLLLQFFGITLFGIAVMCFMARDAAASVGRTAVLWSLAVVEFLFIFLNGKTMMAGSPEAINYVDIVFNAVLGFGAIYFIMQDRKAT
jgi:hypothetical protein